MITELELKYGCNPNQKPARIFCAAGALPVEVLGGRPGYINFLDALNAWQLVRELKQATGLPAAASFKHVSPAGAAIGLELSQELRAMFYIGDAELTPLASAYASARGADRMSSYGDFIALSDVCDLATAKLISKEVSDGVIAPGYAQDALEILRKKRKGTYNILQIDPAYEPPLVERKDVFGVTFEQRRNDAQIRADLFANVVTKNQDVTESAVRDMLIALITLKYTQSNSVCCVRDGRTIGVGAGQQSRIHCTRLACDKADVWNLRRHPKVLGLPFLPKLARVERDNAIDEYITQHGALWKDNTLWQNYFTERPAPLTEEERQTWLSACTGQTLGSDAFFPFGDNIERAHRSGVSYVVQPGGSVRDDHVIETCDRYGMYMVFTGLRLFHH